MDHRERRSRHDQEHDDLDRLSNGDERETEGTFARFLLRHAVRSNPSMNGANDDFGPRFGRASRARPGSACVGSPAVT
jgi:hypothetical protein